jgi:AGZA family xanthine/uracil permease-like MFS transporter
VIIPKATVFPILVFIGLEITAQSFQATPKRHYAAVVLACVPALAALGLIYVDKILGEISALGVAVEQLSESLQTEIQIIRILANGFIVTSLLWASMLAAIIDRRLAVAAVYATIAAVAAFFGIIHSPLPGSPMFVPWDLDATAASTPYGYLSGYLATALLLLIWSYWGRTSGQLNLETKEIEH